jgi:hypothetical protein
MRIFLAGVETVERGVGNVVRRAAFSRTGVTGYGAIELRPGQFICVAQGINSAPSGTVDLGGTVGALLGSLPTARKNTIASRLGITRAEFESLTVGELLLLFDAGTWRPNLAGKVRISLAGELLLERDAIQGGAAEITEPFTYSNGRLSTVSSSAWDDSSANMAVASNAISYTANDAADVGSHNTELSSADHYAQVVVTTSNTGEYAAGGVIVRNDGLAASQDGYRVEVGHWNISGVTHNWAITRYDNGTGTEVAVESIGAGTTSARTLRVEVEGTTITVFEGGVEEGSYGSASSYTTNKFVGIFASTFSNNGAIVTLDSFEAGPLASGTNAAAGNAAATGAANAATTKVSPSGGHASATGAAGAVTSKVSPSGGHASASGAAGAATTKVSPSAGHASATAAAHDATVTTGGATTNADAGNAAATGAAHDAKPSVAPSGGHASATGAAHDVTAKVSTSGGHASATGAAHDATATTAVVGTAGHASATGAASDATTKVSPSGGHAAATGTAHDATVSTGSFTNAAAGNAAATGAANNTQASIAPSGGHASATATAFDASVSIGISAGHASATASAADASASIAVTAALAAATVAAYVIAAAIAPTAGHASATGTAHDGTVDDGSVPTHGMTLTVHDRGHTATIDDRRQHTATIRDQGHTATAREQR